MIKKIREEIIGRNTLINTPYGERLITYADYTASGKSLKFVENYMLDLQKVYANSHTEESMTGKTMTQLVHLSENTIKGCFNALDEDYIIPVGTGATGAIQKLASILGIYYSPGFKEKLDNKLMFRDIPDCGKDCTNDFFIQLEDKKPVVFISPYEHHSNDLIWRESFVDVVEIKLNEQGYLDLLDLEEKVSDPAFSQRMKIGSLSAASNVTGIKTPLYEVAKILHKYGALACFDFAASGPYVEINMNKDEFSYFDAIYLSPHKFLGGPGSSGLLVLNKNLYDSSKAPTIAGGGTVDYVSSEGYDFVHDVEAREMAGTPGILQIIKASMAIELKDKLTSKVIEEIEEDYNTHVFKRFKENDKIDILGPKDPAKRISIFSFNIKDGEGYLHHKFVTKLLNDLFGIQSRAGCACAGPYGHRLLKVDLETSKKYREAVLKGYNSLKPGWVRVNFHYTMTQEEVDYILDAIEFIGEYGYLFLQEYEMDLKSGLWSHRAFIESNDYINGFGIDSALKLAGKEAFIDTEVNHVRLYQEYMSYAEDRVNSLKNTYIKNEESFDDAFLETLRWYSF